MMSNQEIQTGSVGTPKSSCYPPGAKADQGEVLGSLQVLWSVIELHIRNIKNIVDYLKATINCANDFKLSEQAVIDLKVAHSSLLTAIDSLEDAKREIDNLMFWIKVDLVASGGWKDE